MPSPTDSNLVVTFNSLHKDSSEIPKENRVDSADIVDIANSAVHNNSDVVSNAMTSGSSPSTTSFFSDGGIHFTPAPTTSTINSSNDANNFVPVTKKTSPKSSKQHAPTRPARKTRKATNAAANTQGSANSSSNKKDSVTPTLSTTNTIIPPTTSGRSLQSIIPATGSSSLSSAASSRSLPLKDVTQTNIADRYLEFIMYCNPSAPSDLDVSSLIRSFNAVPKSDGKNFDTWVLFQLVSKHHSGEIKTWTKLAQQLGVERTNESSPQKIQQYAVRLKKWMRSIHIDAFFDYILSKSNEYYEDPQKNPTGVEPTNGDDDDDDDSDLVLKLIKRASSKRQKRKYTRRNTGSGINSGNSNTATNDNIDYYDDLDDDDNIVKSEKHRGKRVKAAAYSASEEEDELEDDDERDAWDNDIEMMQVDDPNKNPDEKTESSCKESTVQFVPTRENLLKLGKPKNGTTLNNIPTPNPSPTTMPDIKLHHNPSSAGGDNGHLRVISNSGAAGGPPIRWRSISVGGGPIPIQPGEISPSKSLLPSTTPTSPTHKSNTVSRRKQSADNYSFRVSSKRTQQKQESPNTNWSWPSQSNSSSNNNLSGQDNSGFSYSELLLPPSTVSSDPDETIMLLQERLVKAVGMLEDSQRKIVMLENIVRQREDEVRKRVAGGIKDEIIGLLQKYE